MEVGQGRRESVAQHQRAGYHRALVGCYRERGQGWALEEDGVGRGGPAEHQAERQRDQRGWKRGWGELESCFGFWTIDGAVGGFLN